MSRVVKTRNELLPAEAIEFQLDVAEGSAPSLADAVPAPWAGNGNGASADVTLGRGDDQRLDEIALVYQQAFGRFLRVATAILGDVELARDAVQEAFARAITFRDDYRGNGSLGAWLWRIVVNHACSCRRAGEASAWASERLGHGAARESIAQPSPPDPFLRELVAVLPERQRLALFLRYYADLDYGEIAAALGIRPGTVGAMLNAAHQTLRLRLDELGHRSKEELR